MTKLPIISLHFSSSIENSLKEVMGFTRPGILPIFKGRSTLHAKVKGLSLQNIKLFCMVQRLLL